MIKEITQHSSRGGVAWLYCVCAIAIKNDLYTLANLNHIYCGLVAKLGEASMRFFKIMSGLGDPD